ncbi:MAG: M24 family metallopeptidase [Verrucomicrobiota bacterium]|nr:M24 family metallopeptidase [Verrucomicrobiota bacterium]
MQPENILIVAESEHDANMLYATRMFVPDPFIYFRLEGKSYVVMSDLEIDRARQQAPHCKIISLTRCVNQLKKSGRNNVSGFAPVISQILKSKRLKKISVPANFPLALARELRREKIKVKVAAEGIFPERICKTAEEVKKINAALMMAEVGLSEGIQLLKRAKIGKGGKLMHHNLPLTAEKLRACIDTAIIQAGGVSNHTIVAGGKQGCDPHESGHGILRAHEPIILDVFPRSQKTGYFGDITRTVVKGRAREAVRKMYQTVLHGQEIALQNLKPNVASAEIHKAVQKYFTAQGYKTGRHRGRMEGFFHGTGHGLGLEIHEAPRVSSTSTEILKAGHVITVEPGLYYSNLGGVRLEDVAHITGSGARNLTKFEKVLEI